VFKGRRVEEKNRGGKGDDRDAKKGTPRGKEGSSGNTRAGRRSKDVYEEDCIDLLRELSFLSGQSSSIKFEIYKTKKTIKVEAMRLAALVSECRFYDREKAEELRRRIDKYLEKYLNFE